MSAIELCRTVALGGHLEQCGACGHQRITYNSCRHRACPMTLEADEFIRRFLLHVLETMFATRWLYLMHQRREDCAERIRQATLQYDPVVGITDHDHTVVRAQVYSTELHVGLRQVKGFSSP